MSVIEQRALGATLAEGAPPVSQLSFQEDAMVAVWAPLAQTLEVIAGERSYSMDRTERGWWRASHELGPGEEYQFRLNGKTFPDPRSPWQPNGVHGASRHVDHSVFRWTDANWQAKPLASAVIYELHIGTFTQEGTFDAVIPRLDHLVDLGITHVELMPVAEFLGEHGWGYDGVYPFAPHHAYGGPDGLRRLINACHAKGLAVLLDVVYNHLGPSGNYLPQFGPYFSDRHSTPWGPSLNFDGPHSDEVRRFFCDNAIMWLREYHFDGLRLDAVHAILDSSAIPFLEQLATEVDELKAHLGRHLVLIAESDLNDPRVVRPWELGGFGLDAQWSDDIHHALHSVLTGERAGYYSDFGSLNDLETAMTRPYVYAGEHSEFRKRRHGRPPINLSAHRFIAYQQNHDQLGNRAKGDRLCHLVNDDRAKIGAALVLLSAYVPMLFQGEEWAACTPFQFFVDFSAEPNLAEAVVKGRTTEFAGFGWKPDEIPNPNSAETFERSKLNWDELRQARHARQLEWYRSLIALRRKFSAFTTGRPDFIATACDEGKKWLRVERGPLTIVANLATATQVIPLLDDQPRHVLLASKPVDHSRASSIAMPAEAVAVLFPSCV
jgi:maltooligosyltrehalose trehalohydrolase